MFAPSVATTGVHADRTDKYDSQFTCLQGV